MKLTNIAQSTVSLVLFTLAGAGAVLAAEPAADAQELARALLTGPRTSSAEFPRSTSAAIDAQEQARRMLSGGAAKPDSRPAADAQDQRQRRPLSTLRKGATVSGRRAAKLKSCRR
jgi:hypothetical protein